MQIVMKARFFPWLLVFTLAIWSCSINLGQAPAHSPHQNPNIDWASLNLTGRRIYNTGVIRDDKISTYIQSLNPSTGEITSLSPDREYIASSRGNGIFVMKPDGSELTFLLPDEINSGKVTWIP